VPVAKSPHRVQQSPEEVATDNHIKAAGWKGGSSSVTQFKPRSNLVSAFGLGNLQHVWGQVYANDSISQLGQQQG
jgi:hypothetical protein